jgi:hypothetical protein
MVRAILAGTKTQTRRVMKPQPTHFNPVGVPRLARPVGPNADIACPHGRPGDRLWVRETFACCDAVLEERGRPVFYRATDYQEVKAGRWRPSIHMPRWASRITLEITDVRVERLADISEADAIAEGTTTVRSADWERKHFPDWRREFDAACAQKVKPPLGPTPRRAFQALWEEINGPNSWDANPWVWAISFRRTDSAAAGG